MEKNFEKGEFLTKVEDFAKSMSEMTSEREGVKRGLIVLAVEKVDGESGTKSIITVSGNSEKLAELVAEFATQDATRPLVSQGLKLGTIKTIVEKFGGGDLTINLFINN